MCFAIKLGRSEQDRASLFIHIPCTLWSKEKNMTMLLEGVWFISNENCPRLA